jgi:predicted SnoaL-like aldol condensation-catalyzing enzyme
MGFLKNLNSLIKSLTQTSNNRQIVNRFFGKLQNMENSLKLWHEFVASQKPEILNQILANDVKFHSPFVWKPKDGKAITIAILTTVAKVFEDFKYVRVIIDGKNAALEFEATIGELTLRGVDLIEFNADGKIVDFEVMVRPANALQVLGQEMGRRLSAI